MSIPLSIALFITIWWVVLFAILPFGVRSMHEESDRPAVADPGAPIAPRLMLKAVWTTLVTAVIFAGLYIYVEYG